MRRAPLFRPAGLVDLTLARDGEGIGGHLVGDGGAGGDVAAVSDRDRGDEVCVAADESVVANRAAELFKAVVVRRDRAAAEVDALAAIAVADVGEVRDLRAVADDAVFDLDKVADFDMIADLRVRADIGKGTDSRVRADGALIELRAFTSVSSPTVQSRIMAFGPMVQFLPMTVRPRRIVPGRMTVPLPILTRGSM